MLHTHIRPTAARATRVKNQRAPVKPSKKSQPLDPVDLSRRLNIVIAERQLEDFQLGQKAHQSEPDLLRAWDARDVRSKKTAPPPQDNNHNNNNNNKRSSLLAAPRTSARWVFRTKPAADRSPHDSTDSSATYVNVPRKPNALGQKIKDDVVLEERSSEPARGRSGDAKEYYPPDWTQVDSAGPKPRRLQLLKRISPIAVLKLRLGGDQGPEVEARTRCDTAMVGGQAAMNRKSGVFSKLLAH